MDKNFTVGQVSKMANVSTRTIRYYNEIGLLCPNSIDKNGYRLYSEDDFVKLQRILVLKELGFPLEEISLILKSQDRSKLQENIRLQIELVNHKINHLVSLRDTLVKTEECLGTNEINWNQINSLLNLTNIDKKVIAQYRTSNNLNVRIDLHTKYSQNKINWFSWLLDQIDFSKVSKLLELGCGNGKLWENISIDLRNRDIYLSDISKGMVEDTKKLLNNSKDYSCLVIDCEHIPFKDESFDCIIANHMLFYLKNIEDGLKEIHRVISKKGSFYCSTYGEKHMKEITALVKEFDERIELSDVPLENKFGLNNGKAILEKYFSVVEKKKYQDYLLVDQAEPLIDYILSCHGNQNEYLNHRYNEFKLYIEEILKINGPIKITKDAGLFICGKKRSN